MLVKGVVVVMVMMVGPGMTMMARTNVTETSPSPSTAMASPSPPPTASPSPPPTAMSSLPPTMSSSLPPTMSSLSPTMSSLPPTAMMSPSPTILYVEVESNVFDNFLLLLQRSFSQADAYLTLPVAGLCQCRSLCWSDPRCHGAMLVSGGTSPDTHWCHLTSSYVDNLILTDNNLAKIYLPQESLGHTYLGREGGAVYLCPEVQRTFSQAKDYCANLGFQLAIVKTEREFNVTMKVANIDGTELIVNVVKDNGQLVWGDGTPFSETFPADHLQVITKGASNFYMIAPQKNELLTVLNTKAKRFLCQGLLS